MKAKRFGARVKQKWRQNVKDREIREGIETRVNERDHIAY